MKAKKKVSIYNWAINHIHDELIVNEAKKNLNHHEQRLSLLSCKIWIKPLLFIKLLVCSCIYRFPKKRILGDLLLSIRL